MREQLVGYLLGALEDPEREQVEAELRTNSELQRELELLHESLEPLRAMPADYQPPERLVQRTCEFVASWSVMVPQPTPPHAETFQGAPLSLLPRIDPAAGSGRWSVSDMTVMFGIFLASAMVFFPALLQSRSSARLAACQNNLRNLGVALIRYSQADSDGYFPSLWAKDKLAGAGIYSAKLFEGGYLSKLESLLCPGSKLADEPHRFHVPTQAELAQADEKQLVELQRTMGGSYGYNLGYMSDGVYRSVQNRSRPTYAMMADTPSIHLASRRSENHGGCGQNVLYEDGHVDYVTNCYHPGKKDHIFLNEDGLMAAGSHLDDAVVGHSASRPFPVIPVGLRSAAR